MDITIEHLAAVDMNIAALVNWGITPRLDESGKPVFDGVDRWDDENKDGLRRWLMHGKETGQTRMQRIVIALKIGENCAR